ncbi:hypothetical protein BV25DRAFT_1825764 [Artomyces pyxidatus]|uniref:Uncharacterized protein n=1 Tax=Artomyces pyxidatus TaxID=48021 RepID=A0ACB8T0H5_9AGAM|nr:hypothetical protein BV25DRAFT_1825764 [Artomyces pyxidatus]
MYYTEHRLGSPPPTSHFRPRPWSPDPADPLPSMQALRYQTREQDPVHDTWISQTHQSGRREASDYSVEALDLADYATTLKPHTQFPQPYVYDEYPPSPPPVRPFSVASRSFEPPSFGSSSRGTSSRSPPSSYTQRHPARRPYSLPTPPSSYPSVRPAKSRTSLEHASAFPSEIDIAHFPAWSRGWYANGPSLDKHAAVGDPDAAHAAFFDPAYKHSPASYSDLHHGAYSAASHESGRELLPWSHTDPPEYGLPLGEEMKEERMRMLEREFAGKGIGGEYADGDEKPPVVGSVDEKGRLVTQGPRKRTALRVFEGSMALGVAISSIYAALEIKPPKPPPPQGAAQTYVLYILSIVTVLVFVYLFLVRPCCCAGRRKPSNLTGSGLPGGMAVLPVQGLPGMGKKPKGKKGKNEQGNVHVNLIVDPNMFSGGNNTPGDDGEDEGEDEYGSSVVRRRPPKRRSVFEGLAMEEMWNHARKELRWIMVLDVVCLLLWGIEFVWILIGQRCPPGSFDGWCNAYNVATAGACLLCLAFGISVFFDVKDLHQSKQSPRTRT